MDDDQKNVRLLQELLLEDGELHSDGQRTRKFQWKSTGKLKYHPFPYFMYALSGKGVIYNFSI